ncbi:MAG: hypothetical protein ACRC6B_03320 [Fusobacteriaceae bacterium]
MFTAMFINIPLSAKEIVLVSSEDTFKSKYGCWLYSIYNEAFTRLGYSFYYRGVPGGRAPKLAESGQVDGEIHRPFEYQRQTKNLIRVNEAHFKITLEAYVVNRSLTFNSWDDLSEKGLRIEFRRGSKRAENMLLSMIEKSQLTDVTSTEQGLKKLLKGRTDVFIEQGLVFDKNIKELLKKSDEYGKIRSAGIVDTLDGYAYLNIKHIDLADKLAVTIKTMKQEGLIEDYKQNYCYHD